MTMTTMMRLTGSIERRVEVPVSPRDRPDGDPVMKLVQDEGGLSVKLRGVVDILDVIVIALRRLQVHPVSPVEGALQDLTRRWSVSRGTDRGEQGEGVERVEGLMKGPPRPGSTIGVDKSSRRRKSGKRKEKLLPSRFAVQFSQPGSRSPTLDSRLFAGIGAVLGHVRKDNVPTQQHIIY